MYVVSISEASKDGEIVKFTVATKVSEDDQSQTGKIVFRQYEDFEFLLHCLTTSYDCIAAIIPPLPNKPVIQSNSNDAKLKLKAPTSNTVSGDDYMRDCQRFERFIQDLLAHPLFSEDETLKKFLTDEEPAVRANVKRGIFDSVATLVDTARYQNYKDSDSEFQSFRANTNGGLINTKQCFLNSLKLKSSNNGLSSQYGNISVAVRNTPCLDVRNSDEFRRIQGKFADTLDELMVNQTIAQDITDETLNFTLELYSRYLLACQEMLFRRTCRLVKFEAATKALEKATPKNREQLLEAKEEASQIFDTVSEKGKVEYERFTKNRIEHYRDSLTSFAEKRMKNHQDAVEIISKCLNELR